MVASASVGPSVLLAASNSINFGRKKALWGITGHVSAILVLAIISATGLGAILLASEATFTLIKYIGAGYLTFIGIKIWRSKSSFLLPQTEKSAPSSIKLYRQSFILGLSNPKALMFFSALFPQFIQANSNLLPQFLILTATSLFNGFLFTALYVFFADKCKRKLAKNTRNSWISRLTGGLFVGFAGVLVISH